MSSRKFIAIFAAVFVAAAVLAAVPADDSAAANIEGISIDHYKGFKEGSYGTLYVKVHVDGSEPKDVTFRVSYTDTGEEIYITDISCEAETTTVELCFKIGNTGEQNIKVEAFCNDNTFGSPVTCWINNSPSIWSGWLPYVIIVAIAIIVVVVVLLWIRNRPKTKPSMTFTELEAQKQAEKEGGSVPSASADTSKKVYETPKENTSGDTSESEGTGKIKYVSSRRK